MIDAIALLHQHQRQAKPAPYAPDGAGGGVNYIEVTREDIALANELAPEVLGRSLDELPPQTRRLLAHVRELMKQKRQEQGAPAASAFSRKELRDISGWSLTQVSVHLERLIALEYLTLRHGRLGSAFVYEILFDLDAPEPVAHIGLLDVAQLKAKGAAPYDYNAEVTGFSAGVSGENGQVTGGAEIAPAPLAPLAVNALAAGSRGDGFAHLAPTPKRAIVT